MPASNRLRVHPGTLEAAPESEFVVTIPYTDPEVTRAVLERAVVLAQGLKVRIALVAVHPAPYPAPLGCPSAMHAFLVERLLELCRMSPVRADAQIVVARSLFEGFRHALKPDSIVLLATRKRLWRTREERLARMLTAHGHKVNLIKLG